MKKIVFIGKREEEKEEGEEEKTYSAQSRLF